EPEDAAPQLSSEDHSQLASENGPSASSSSPAADPMPDIGPARPAPAASGDEESIESYMERLMQRVRGSTALSQSSSKSLPTLISNSTPLPAPEPTPEPEPAAA